MTRYAWLAVLLGASALGVAYAWWPEAPREPRIAAQPALARVAAVRRETRPTLDPARFVGKAAQAHQVAREIPDVLDQLYCYCECDKHAGHKSLLSCYTDGHAAT
ncbi:MAG: hypothetical protein HYU26_06680 [Candidatus Rokubacteria bacterium]|nr:hypothetical protein [Candidatus Rokubacteria bacterium]